MHRRAPAEGDKWIRMSDPRIDRGRVCLGVILLLALAVRLWGIGFGLPNEAARPDERHLIGYTLTMGGNHLNPGFFNYPSLYLYLLLSTFVCYFGIGRSFGHFGSLRDLVSEYALSPAPLYLIDRCLVALLGTATVYLVYLIGARWVNRRVGLLAAFFLAVAYLHVRESHFGTVDVPLTFFVTLATVFLLRAEDSPTPRRFALAGLFAGLAISTKYNGLALLAPLALLHARPSVDFVSPRLRVAGPLLTVAFVVIGFVVGTPFSVLDHATFFRDAAFELIHKSQEAPVPDLGRGWIYHLRYSLPEGLGVPLLLAALGGVVVGLREKRRRALLLLAFPLSWWLGVGMSRYVYLRYAVPLVPSLCLFAGWATDAGLRRVARISKGGTFQGALVTGAVALVLVAGPAWRTIQWDRLVRRTDTRVLAASWIQSHVPGGETLGVVGPEYLWPQVWNASSQLRRYTQSPEAQRSQGRRLRAELRLAYVETHGLPSYDTKVWTDGAWIDTLVARQETGGPSPPSLSDAEAGRRADDPWPSWVILADHPAWNHPPGSIPDLGSSYVAAATFQGTSDSVGDSFYNRQDAFYFPYAGFSGVERPGPNLHIYHRGP